MTEILQIYHRDTEKGQGAGVKKKHFNYSAQSHSERSPAHYECAGRSRRILRTRFLVAGFTLSKVEGLLGMTEEMNSYKTF